MVVFVRKQHTHERRKQYAPTIKDGGDKDLPMDRQQVGLLLRGLSSIKLTEHFLEIPLFSSIFEKLEPFLKSYLSLHQQGVSRFSMSTLFYVQKLSIDVGALFHEESQSAESHSSIHTHSFTQWRPLPCKALPIHWSNLELTVLVKDTLEM